MRIRITKGGIFGMDGELPIGTELDVKDEPEAWAGRYEVLSESKKVKAASETKDDEPERVAVTNPAKDALPAKKD